MKKVCESLIKSNKEIEKTLKLSEDLIKIKPNHKKIIENIFFASGFDINMIESVLKNVNDLFELAELHDELTYKKNYSKPLTPTSIELEQEIKPRRPTKMRGILI